MSDFQINDHLLTKECDQLAVDIFAEMLEGMADDETPDDHRDDMNDRAHEAADGHGWVIYTYKAIQLCARCDVSQGEQFLEDVGGVEKGETFSGMATKIAYGEMRARIEAELQRLSDEWEAPEVTA